MPAAIRTSNRFDVLVNIPDDSNIVHNELHECLNDCDDFIDVPLNDMFKLGESNLNVTNNYPDVQSLPNFYVNDDSNVDRLDDTCVNETENSANQIEIGQRIEGTITIENDNVNDDHDNVSMGNLNRNYEDHDSSMNSSLAGDMITNESDVSIIENVEISITENVENDDINHDVNNMQNYDETNLINDNVNGTRNLRNSYPENMIIGHLNVNSLGMKFMEVSDLVVNGRFEVLVLSETKLDNSNRDSLYEIENYSMYRQDKQSNSGGMMIYVSKNIPSTPGNFKICNDEIECLSIELCYNETKILIVGMYKNPKMKHNVFKQFFEKTCEEIHENFEHVIIIGDLNCNMLQNNVLSQMCPILNLTNIIREPTCFKSNNPTLLDVMLVTKRRKFIKGFSIDTGISDFHNLIGGVMRQHAPVPPTKTIAFRKLKEIDYEKVNLELTSMKLEEIANEHDANGSFNKLHHQLVNILNRHAPKKHKVIKKNDFHCMSKRLKKAILIRNQFRNKFFKFRTSFFLAQYRKHRNIVTMIKRSEIKSYFEEKCKGNTRNKDFWKAIKPIFSKTKTKSDNIPLRENGKIITNTSEVCQIFNKFFSEIGSDIGNPENNHRPLEEIIADYDNHQSVNLIRNEINHGSNNINFNYITESQVQKVISKLSSKKASGYDEIPVKFIKMTSRSLIKPLTILANKCIQQSIFPDRMKMANITPLYKKKDKLNKDNFRSVNLLIALSKIVEKLLANQIYEHMQCFFHEYLSGFRKGHGCHDILTRMTEDWRQALDNGKTVGIMAIDLSKAFDCMPHGLLIAKAHAYGFSLNACKLLKSYLVNRKQRVKIGETLSEWTNNVKGVPQGSILGPLLFNVFINDLLFHDVRSKVYNYADDNTLCYIGNDIDEIKRHFQVDCNMAMKWFNENGMKANAEKFQLMFLNRNMSYSEQSLEFHDCVIRATSRINILGIEFDDKIKFESHIDEICNQTSKQVNALKRMKHHLDKQCKKVVYNSYIRSNFNYCPTVWMFTGKMNIDKLEKTNKRALRFVVNDNE